jgi:hypothetical protein
MTRILKLSAAQELAESFGGARPPIPIPLDDSNGFYLPTEIAELYSKYKKRFLPSATGTGDLPCVGPWCGHTTFGMQFTLRGICDIVFFRTPPGSGFPFGYTIPMGGGVDFPVDQVTSVFGSGLWFQVRCLALQPPTASASVLGQQTTWVWDIGDSDGIPLPKTADAGWNSAPIFPVRYPGQWGYPDIRGIDSLYPETFGWPPPVWPTTDSWSWFESSENRMYSQNYYLNLSIPTQISQPLTPMWWGLDTVLSVDIQMVNEPGFGNPNGVVMDVTDEYSQPPYDLDAGRKAYRFFPALDGYSIGGGQKYSWSEGQGTTFRIKISVTV